MANAITSSISFFNNNLHPKFNYKVVPDELIKQTRWVDWKHGSTPDIKLPIDPKTGFMASVSDPKTWATFKKAKASIHKYKADGLAFMVGDGYYFADMNDIAKEAAAFIVDPDNKQNPIYWLYRDTGKTYGEITPSGRGLHFIGKIDGKGKPDGSGSIAGKNCLYDQHAFVIITGWVFQPLHEQEIVSITDKQLHKLMTDIGLKVPVIKAKAKDAEQSKKKDDVGNLLTVDEVLTKVKAENYRSNIFSGDYSGYLKKDGSPDWSAIDMAVTHKIGFWANRDKYKMDQAFRKSGFYRAKWDQVHYANGMTYGQHTIWQAVKDLGHRGYRGKKKKSKDQGQR